jgi:hypothetical protein
MQKTKSGSQKSTKKKRRGRPAIGENHTVRLPDHWVEQIDQMAKEHDLTRSEAIRKLIEAGYWKYYPRTRRQKPDQN